MGGITGHQIGDKSDTRNNLITTMDRMLNDPDLILCMLLKVSKEKESFYASGKFITTEHGTMDKLNELSDLGMDIVEKLEDHFNTEKHSSEDHSPGVSHTDALVKELREDPAFAKQYLIECVNDTENPLVLEYAIRNIIAAIGNKSVATALLNMLSNPKSYEMKS